MTRTLQCLASLDRYDLVRSNTMKYIILIICVIATLGLQAQVNIATGDRLGEEDISMERLYIEANQLKILNKYEDAIKVYDKILDVSEVNAAVHHDMARIYLELEDNDKAVSAAKKAVRYAPDNLWYALTLTQIYEETIQYDAAAKTLASIISQKTDETLYMRWAVNLDLAEKKMEAIQVYDQADKIFGWNEYRSDSKVDIYLALDKKKEASREVAKWSDKYPDNTHYLVKLARYYEFQGDHKRSVRTYKKVLSLDPSNEEALFKTRETKDSGQSNELAILINDDRIGIDNKIKSIIPLLDDPDTHPQVKDLCTSLISQYPDNAKSYALYGDVLWLSGESGAAITQYEKSLSINKSVYQVWEQIMLALTSQKSYDILEKWSSDALDYYPNQAGPYYYQAVALSATGHIEEALEINDEALFIGQAKQDYITEQSQILKATLLDLLDQPKEAISYVTSIEAEAMTAGLYELLGDLYIKTGDKASAEKAWIKSIESGGNKERIGLKINSI